VREIGLPCFALTNKEAKTYSLRVKRFPFLGWFDWTVASGREGVTASTLGIKTARFRSSRQLRADLEAVGVLARSLAAPYWSDCRRLLVGEPEYVKLGRIPVTA
jgi:hypothetical protein